MIYKFKKYKSIDDFVNNASKAKKDEEYTICSECNGFDFGKMDFTDKCFGCLFCIFEDNNLNDKFIDKWGANFISDYAQKSFKGNIVSMPSAKKILRNPTKDLEAFTGVNETKNIQPWTAGIINHTCSTENRMGMEIPVFNMDYDRNGRLDVCSITENGHLVVLETKISLDDALKDERFIEQQAKYTSEIKKSTSDFEYLTLFGGKETDLLPITHKECTGKVGGKTERFYSMVNQFGIKFVSANAIWCMCCSYITYGSRYAWDVFLKAIFADDNCVGLISAGKIIKQNNSYLLKEI